MHRIASRQPLEQQIIRCRRVTPRRHPVIVIRVIHHQRPRVHIPRQHEIVLRGPAHQMPRLWLAASIVQRRTLENRAREIPRKNRKRTIQVRVQRIRPRFPRQAIRIQKRHKTNRRRIHERRNPRLHAIALQQHPDKLKAKLRSHPLIPMNRRKIPELRLILLDIRIVRDQQRPQFPPLRGLPQARQSTESRISLRIPLQLERHPRIRMVTIKILRASRPLLPQQTHIMAQRLQRTALRLGGIDRGPKPRNIVHQIAAVDQRLQRGVVFQRHLDHLPLRPRGPRNAGQKRKEKRAHP